MKPNQDRHGVAEKTVERFHETDEAVAITDPKDIPYYEHGALTCPCQGFKGNLWSNLSSGKNHKPR